MAVLSPTSPTTMLVAEQKRLTTHASTAPMEKKRILRRHERHLTRLFGVEEVKKGVGSGSWGFRLVLWRESSKVRCYPAVASKMVLHGYDRKDERSKACTFERNLTLTSH